MRKILLAAMLFLLSLQVLQAQDVITKRTGEKVQAKVLEIAPTEIRYKRSDNLEGPTYVVPKTDILLIEYADNTTETFDLEEVKLSAATIVDLPAAGTPGTIVSTSENLYAKGEADALHYYDGYKAAGTGTLVASLVSPLLGLVPAVACSSSTPKEQNLDAPDHQLLQQPDYQSGYRKQARKVKSRNVWKNWGIGLGVNIVLAVLLASQ